MRFLLYTAFKILLLPVILVLLLVQMVLHCLSGITGWIFRLFGSICLFTAVGMYGMGRYSGQEILEMLVCSIVIYAIPEFGGGLANRISAFAEFLAGI